MRRALPLPALLPIASLVMLVIGCGPSPQSVNAPDLIGQYQQHGDCQANPYHEKLVRLSAVTIKDEGSMTYLCAGLSGQELRCFFSGHKTEHSFSPGDSVTIVGKPDGGGVPFFSPASYRVDLRDCRVVANGEAPTPSLQEIQRAQVLQQQQQQLQQAAEARRQEQEQAAFERERQQQQQESRREMAQANAQRARQFREEGVVVVTEYGGKYHRPGSGCLSRSKTLQYMTPREAREAGYGPCSRCF